jgi:hypothetical protein
MVGCRSRAASRPTAAARARIKAKSENMQCARADGCRQAYRHALAGQRVASDW